MSGARQILAEAQRLRAESGLPPLTPHEHTVRILARYETARWLAASEACALCRPRRPRAAGRLDCAECCVRVAAEEAALHETRFGAAQERHPLGPESDGSAAEPPYLTSRLGR